MFPTTYCLAVLLLASHVALAQDEISTDGFIVYLKTTEVQPTHIYTINDVPYSYVEATYWSQINTVYPGDGVLTPSPDDLYTSGSDIYVLMTQQIRTAPYSSGDGVWSYMYTSYWSKLDTITPSIAASATLTLSDLSTHGMPSPSTSFSTATTNSDALSTSTALGESKSTTSNGLIAGCIIGGVAFIVITLLTGWIIYLQRRIDGKTRMNDTTNFELVHQEEKFNHVTGSSRELPAYQGQVDYQPKGIAQVGLQAQNPNTARSPLEPHYGRRIELSS